jgi:hypothetical protein
LKNSQKYIENLYYFWEKNNIENLEFDEIADNTELSYDKSPIEKNLFA